MIIFLSCHVPGGGGKQHPFAMSSWVPCTAGREQRGGERGSWTSLRYPPGVMNKGGKGLWCRGWQIHFGIGGRKAESWSRCRSLSTLERKGKKKGRRTPRSRAAAVGHDPARGKEGRFTSTMSPPRRRKVISTTARVDYTSIALEKRGGPPRRPPLYTSPLAGEKKGKRSSATSRAFPSRFLTGRRFAPEEKKKGARRRRPARFPFYLSHKKRPAVFPGRVGKREKVRPGRRAAGLSLAPDHHLIPIRRGGGKKTAASWAGPRGVPDLYEPHSRRGEKESLRCTMPSPQFDREGGKKDPPRGLDVRTIHPGQQGGGGGKNQSAPRPACQLDQRKGSGRRPPRRCARPIRRLCRARGRKMPLAVFLSPLPHGPLKRGKKRFLPPHAERSTSFPLASFFLFPTCRAAVRVEGREGEKNARLDLSSPKGGGKKRSRSSVEPHLYIPSASAWKGKMTRKAVPLRQTEEGGEKICAGRL